jgi:hypothetical protein
MLTPSDPLLRIRRQCRGARTGADDAWVLYGVLDGTESLERYERIDDGRRPGHAEVQLASVTTGTQGKVDLVPPHAIAAHCGDARDTGASVRRQRTGTPSLVLASRLFTSASKPFELAQNSFT